MCESQNTPLKTAILYIKKELFIFIVSLVYGKTRQYNQETLMHSYILFYKLNKITKMKKHHFDMSTQVGAPYSVSSFST